MRATLVLAMLCSLVGCGGPDVDTAGNGREAAARSWWRWHEGKRDVDLAVAEAVNAPNGGDYARAVDILRASDRPEPLRQYQIGMTIINGFDQPAARRPPETLARGLRMVEGAIVQPGEPREVGPQHLRILFERGVGRAPDAIPVDPVIAACWHRLENNGSGDPAACVALRRQRLPRFDR